MIIDASTVNTDLKLICSTSEHSNDNSKPLFFYHLQKTGGISFSNALSIAFNVQKQAGNNSLRIDDKESLKMLKGKDIKFLTSPKLPYGSHKDLGKEFLLTAFIRSPYSRVKSHYTYTCMRSQTKPTDTGFEEFFKTEENCNLISKRLHPNATAGEQHDASSVIENLHQNFHSYADYKHVNTFLSYYLSLYKLPNVLTERVNKTLPDYQYDGDKFKDYILELNMDDTEVCDYVIENPRIPSLKECQKKSIAAHTIIFDEFEKLKATKQRAKIVKTQDLISAINSNPEHYSNTACFF